jgi:hypothetical protein
MVIRELTVGAIILLDAKVKLSFAVRLGTLVCFADVYGIGRKYNST